MTIRVFEAFAGVGSQRMALRNLGIDHEVVAISDVDEFTIKGYASIHDNDKTVSEATNEEMQDYLEKRNIPLNDKGVRKNLKGKKLKEFYEACVKSNNLGDISKVETHDIPDHDLFTYSFPCQDISVAGKGSGLDEGSDTRSGLLWECQKVIYGKRPKYLLLENVKNLVGKKHKHNFDKWLEWLEKQGYTNYWQVLNAKDYGVPQNRERVFVVSILGHHEPYEFPEAIELELRLKDVLEDVVDEKYYLDNEKANKLISTVASKHDINEPTPTDDCLKKLKPREVANAITAGYDAGVSNQQSMGTMVIEPKAERIGGIFDKDGTKHQAGAVWDKNHLSPALDTMQGGWRQPSVVVGASRGRNPENPSDRTVGSPTEQRLEINKQGTSNTITTVQKDNYVVEPSARRDIKEMEKYCEYCSNKLERKRFNGRLEDFGVFNKRKYCNRDCMKKSYVMVGKNNQSWSTAHATARKINELFLNKDSCEICGSEKSLDIHHIDGDWQNNNLDNLMCLCRSCHMKCERRRDKNNNYRIRKLTPLETWRLMGFSDDDFHKAEEVNSNTQLYKQAGNSIVVDVLEGIFKQLLEVAEWNN